jgi:hypothetical protein
MVLAAIAVVALSAREALAATRTLRKADCEVTNWCSVSTQNCTECCQENSYKDGMCFSFDPGIQGCICV